MTNKKGLMFSLLLAACTLVGYASHEPQTKTLQGEKATISVVSEHSPANVYQLTAPEGTQFVYAQFGDIGGATSDTVVNQVGEAIGVKPDTSVHNVIDAVQLGVALGLQINKQKLWESPSGIVLIIILILGFALTIFNMVRHNSLKKDLADPTIKVDK